MSVNVKVIKVLNKLFDDGFTAEKDISAMNLDDMLGIQGISVPEISIINDLQKSIKGGKRQYIILAMFFRNLAWKTYIICIKSGKGYR